MTSRRFIMVSQSLSLPPQCVPDYLVERYHRTFEPEAERIRALLRAFSPEPGVASALSTRRTTSRPTIIEASSLVVVVDRSSTPPTTLPCRRT
jgi:hypothetical protein